MLENGQVKVHPAVYEFYKSFSETGLLGFALFYTLFGVIIGHLADKYSRRNIIPAPHCGCRTGSGFDYGIAYGRHCPQTTTARFSGRPGKEGRGIKTKGQSAKGKVEQVCTLNL